MTVCIAGVCMDAGKWRIVLCYDSRLDYGSYGSTNTALKFDVLGHGWGVLKAGKWQSAKELTRILSEVIKSYERIETHETIYEAIGTALTRFRATPLFSDHQCELLVCGFINGEPLVISISGKKLEMQLASEFMAIGSGALIATVVLGLREYTRMISLNAAMYALFEAKRFSEKEGSVGKITSIVVLAPPTKDSKPDTATIAFVDVPGMKHLDELFTKWGGFRPIPSLSHVDGFFMDPSGPRGKEALRFSIYDPLNQPPSRE